MKKYKQLNYFYCRNRKSYGFHIPVTAGTGIEKRNFTGRLAKITITDFHTTAVDGASFLYRPQYLLNLIIE